MSIKHGRDYKNEPSQKNLYPVLGTGGEITKIDTFLCDWSCACIGRKGTINKPIYMDSPFWCVDTLFYSQPFHGENSKFQYYLFETINWVLYNEASGVPSLSASTIEKIRVNVPNINEQIKIVQFFSLIDCRISKQRELIDKLKSYKRGLLSRLFPKNGKTVPELRFSEFTADWEQRKLDDCMKTVADYVAAGSFADIAANVEYKNNPDYAQLIRTVDLKHNFDNDGFIYVDKNAFEYLWRVNLNSECIILPNIGANIGEVYYVEPSMLPHKNNVLGPNAIYLKTKNSTKFMYSLFQTDKFQYKLSVSTASSGQPKFNKTELKEISFSVPLVEEQEKIGKYLFNIDTLITLHQEKWELYVNIKNALLQKMFI